MRETRLDRSHEQEGRYAAFESTPLARRFDMPEPGQSSRSGALRRPEHAVASGLVQRKAQDAASERSAGASNTARARALQLKSSGDPASDPAKITAVAESGLGGGGGELPHRAVIEHGYGIDLSHVRAHTGDAASQASRAIGAEAYTMGSDIAFASPSPSRELVAHEVAHVIQQRAGAGPSSGVGTSGDVFEREADAAAAIVAGGGHSDLASSYAPSVATSSTQRKAVQRYESAEHAMIVDGMTYPVVVHPRELPNHAHATPGEIVAFGDFYGSYEAIANAPREETEALIGLIRWEGIWTLAGRKKAQGTVDGLGTNRKPVKHEKLETTAKPDDTGFHGGHAEHDGDRDDLVTWDGPEFNTKVGGIKLRDRAMEIHAQFTPSWNFFDIHVPLKTFSHDALTVHHMKATLGRRRFRNTNNTLGSPQQDDRPGTNNPRISDPAGLGGDYIDLATNNVAHFAVGNWETWKHYHRRACESVHAARSKRTVDPKIIERAEIEDLWGCHYLTDMYASGHVIDKQDLMIKATDKVIALSQKHGQSKEGDDRHEVLTHMLTEALQLAFRDEGVYRAWEKGCRNALDQGLIRSDELGKMIWIPKGTVWSKPVVPSVVSGLVATIMGMPWRNRQPSDAPGGDRPKDGRPENQASFGSGAADKGEGDYHLGVGNLAALAVHNALNSIGFKARTKGGSGWRMQGDGHLTVEARNAASAAVNESKNQVRSGHYDESKVKAHTPQEVQIAPDSNWVAQYLAERCKQGLRYDKKLKGQLDAKVAALRKWVPLVEGKMVSKPIAELSEAIMNLELNADRDEYQALLDKYAPPDENHQQSEGSMTNTGINISFLCQFLKENLPRMVPLAYVAASPGDLPTAALEVYRPRDDRGRILPTAANDFEWGRSTVRFRVNVSDCEPKKSYELGIEVYDPSGDMDYLPSGQLRDTPGGKKNDKVCARGKRTVDVPDRLTPDSNGSTYVNDVEWELTGDADHGKSYIRVFADPRYQMVIGCSSSRDSGAASNPGPVASNPRTTSSHSKAITHYNATGVDRDAFAWDGNRSTVRFRLETDAPRDTAQGMTVNAWIKQFDRDNDYDYDESGREIPTAWLEPRNDDKLVRGPTMVDPAIQLIDGLRLTEQVVFDTVDNDNDTYIIVFANVACTQPLARSSVQGTDKGSVRDGVRNPANKARSFSWLGNRLTFAVTPPTAAKVWVKLFDQDGNYDYNTEGKLIPGLRIKDKQYNGIHERAVKRGQTFIEVTGDAAAKDTYAIVYADPACTLPLGRSDVRGK